MHASRVDTSRNLFSLSAVGVPSKLHRSLPCVASPPRAAATVLVLGLAADLVGPGSQRWSCPRPASAPRVSQTVGLTEISITYDRPAVKGREIWGKLVPYDSVWRAGANENTVIAFSSPVRVGGKDLPAGRYGVHMIPTAERVDGDPEQPGRCLGQLQLRPEGRRGPLHRHAGRRRRSRSRSATPSTTPAPDR